ncbi:Probable RNA-directed DNA polymerase from transposon BS [Eumeta japonica]|uniref:Probable RNA-directed DNA polymerase from transposon BS n=1 Tax=Eumeta variegata TaxID=151549 RepID=A0A4C1ZIF6_EUMVA|nr:Probable RNA-directed DNA polymerase from transposon BS [Eumeta japonica]
MVTVTRWRSSDRDQTALYGYRFNIWQLMCVRPSNLNIANNEEADLLWEALVGRTLERVMHSRLPEPEHVRPNLEMTDHQSINQALRLVEHISESFKRKYKTVTVFFDVAKAFDKVWHVGLIYKLHQLQVPDRLVFIIQQYLTNRHFSFRHENSISAKRLIGARVPPGTTLSPLLYSAYTNNNPRPQIGIQLAPLADNTAIYLRGSNFRQITPRLQKAIDGLTHPLDELTSEVERLIEINKNMSEIQAQTLSCYDIKRLTTRCAPRDPGTPLGNSAHAECPRDFLCRDAHLVASIGQSRADCIPCRSATIDEVLKASIYGGYGQQPFNMLLWGSLIRESRTHPTHTGTWQLISEDTVVTTWRRQSSAAAHLRRVSVADINSTDRQEVCTVINGSAIAGGARKLDKNGHPAQ